MVFVLDAGAASWEPRSEEERGPPAVCPAAPLWLRSALPFILKVKAHGFVMGPEHTLF